MKETLKCMWVCVNKDGCIATWTIDCQRKGSIEKLMKNFCTTWSELKKYGRKCIKVNVTFEQTK